MVLPLQAFQENAGVRNPVGLPLRDPGGSKLRRGRRLGVKIQNWGSPNSSVAEQEHERQLKFNLHNLELIGYLPEKIKLLFKKIKSNWTTWNKWFNLGSNLIISYHLIKSIA